MITRSSQKPAIIGVNVDHLARVIVLLSVASAPKRFRASGDEMKRGTLCTFHWRRRRQSPLSRHLILTNAVRTGETTLSFLISFLPSFWSLLYIHTIRTVPVLSHLI